MKTNISKESRALRQKLPEVYESARDNNFMKNIFTLFSYSPQIFTVQMEREKQLERKLVCSFLFSLFVEEKKWVKGEENQKDYSFIYECKKEDLNMVESAQSKLK